ncbi:MAG: hypothetical protein ACOYN7_08435, partial [Candidatus Nanopelagicales bacterium]
VTTAAYVVQGRSVKTLTLVNYVNARVFVVKYPIYGDLTTKTRASSRDGVRTGDTCHVLLNFIQVHPY